jgi:hypothetical protein
VPAGHRAPLVRLLVAVLLLGMADSMALPYRMLACPPWACGSAGARATTAPAWRGK